MSAHRGDPVKREKMSRRRSRIVEKNEVHANSSTPLIKKLGIKEGDKIRVINSPVNYIELLGELPEQVDLTKGKK